jgi:hypothetical protein
MQKSSGPKNLLKKTTAGKSKGEKPVVSDTKQYQYTDLKSSAVGSDKLNFFAVILSAQFPHKSFKSQKYLCSFTIADPTCEIDKKTGLINYCTLVVFANRFEDLPTVQRVGDIIRVHRASVQMYNGNKQFSANCFFTSSWALFPPSINNNSDQNEEFKPNQFFGKTISVDTEEQQIVRKLRKWTGSIFPKNMVLNS